MRLRWAKGDMNCWLIWEGRQWRVLEPQLPLFLNYRKGDSVGVFPLECMGITETHYILRSLKNKNIYWQKHCYLSSNEAGSEMKYVWINGKVFLCNKFFYKLPLLSWDPGSGLQITVAHRILTNQICQCPMRSHLCLDIMSGEFFCRKSFYGKEEWKSTLGKSYFVLGQSWGHETTMTWECMRARQSSGGICVSRWTKTKQRLLVVYLWCWGLPNKNENPLWEARTAQ